MYYYKQVKDGQIVSVEAKSLDATSPNFVKATKAEYDGFIASLPAVEPEPPLVFEPPAGTGMPEKVEYIEQFLKRAFGRQEQGL